MVSLGYLKSLSINARVKAIREIPPESRLRLIVLAQAGQQKRLSEAAEFGDLIYSLAGEPVPVQYSPKPASNVEKFGQAVFDALDGQEWNGDTFESIKDAARANELTLRSPEEVEPEPALPSLTVEAAQELLKALKDLRVEEKPGKHYDDQDWENQGHNEALEQVEAVLKLNVPGL